MKNTIFSKQFIFAISFIMLFSTCSKDDEEQTADYNGNWEITYSIPQNTGYINAKYELSLNNSNYTESFPTFYLSSNVYHYNVWEGKVTKRADAIQFEVTNMKTYNYNPYTDEVLDLVSETIPTEPHIDSYLTLSWETANYTMTDGNLVFSVDWNDDGDYLDENETLVYTRAANK